MPRIASLLCLLSVGFFASCSSFDWQWAQTPTPAMANPATLMDGKWEGTWQSDATDYNGQIRSLVIHTTEALIDKEKVQQYTASFRYAWFYIPFNEITLTVNATKMDDGRIRFEGKKDVGFYAGGILHLDGYIFPDKDMMYCDYTTEKDSGTYKLRRILADNQ
jgi:hypothetical protein